MGKASSDWCRNSQFWGGHTADATAVTLFLPAFITQLRNFVLRHIVCDTLVLQNTCFLLVIYWFPTEGSRGVSHAATWVQRGDLCSISRALRDCSLWIFLILCRGESWWNLRRDPPFPTAEAAAVSGP